MNRSIRFVMAFFLIPLSLGLGLSGCACTLELGMVVDPSVVTLAVGETVTPKAYTTTCGGLVKDEAPPLRWRSEEPNIASVSETGKIQGQSSGTTVIYAEGAGEESFYGKVEVTVTGA